MNSKGISKKIFIPSNGISIAAELALPSLSGKFPCVIIAGGTMSHTMDGNLIADDCNVPVRTALKVLAERLLDAGYASIRWDKRGYGETPKGKDVVCNDDETDDLISIYNYLSKHENIDKIVIAGESAGGYFACQAAQRGTIAHGYIMLGALCSDIEIMYAHNYERLLKYAEKSEENMKWAESLSTRALAVGKNYKDLFHAAEDGLDNLEISWKDKKYNYSLARMKEELMDTPSSLFKYLTTPTLVLQGDRDMNVPVGDAEMIEKILLDNGNIDVVRINIPFTDHSFQMSAATEDERIRERHSFSSFTKPYSENLYISIITWLNRRFPVEKQFDYREHSDKTINKPNEETIQWSGIKIISDITNTDVNYGVDTLEGKIGPLIFADGCTAHYIDMPKGMFLDEHSHLTESIIYTVKGDWVLCSEGIRRHMKPGTLYWFKAGAPTGYEVPFEKDAYILIFKGQRGQDSEEDFIEYLKGLSSTLLEEHEKGTAFLISELPYEHPAKVFARQINPDFKE